MRRATCRMHFAVIGLTLLLSGCAGPRVMMPTPNVYLGESDDYFADLSPELQSTEVRLFYVTDRAPEEDKEGKVHYGYERSASLGFGTAIVDLGVNISWEELVEASRTQKRLKAVKLEMGEVEELVRAPPTPLPFTEVDGEVVLEPRLAAQFNKAEEEFRRTLVRQLELTPRKEVFLYVHGYHNTFEDAAFAMAELWHFLGRIGVPMIYTWPAGYPGLFGYTYDRESSEFTVYHFREAVQLIAGIPEVEKIHLIAHSRGTDVAVSALRELTIKARGAGLNPVQEYKVHNFVLAAPDLDVSVAEQRVLGDHLELSAGRVTIYTSPADRAIGIAALLFDSPRGRIGNYGFEHATDLTRTAMEFADTNFASIDYPGIGGSIGDRYGHSYFRNAPSVSSDLVLMLRDDIDAGAPGRPLQNVGLQFWTIPTGYPRHQ